MSKQLQSLHPILMVPHVYTFSVVLYTNGSAPTFPADTIRHALCEALPMGTGISEVTCTYHGVNLRGETA